MPSLRLVVLQTHVCNKNSADAMLKRPGFPSNLAVFGRPHGLHGCRLLTRRGARSQDDFPPEPHVSIDEDDLFETKWDVDRAPLPSSVGFSLSFTRRLAPQRSLPPKPQMTSYGTPVGERYTARIYPKLNEEWFFRSQFQTAAALRDEILRRSEFGQAADVASLYYICQLAEDAAGASCVLDAVAAVRSVMVQQGNTASFGTKFARRIAMLCAMLHAPEVLSSAMRRCNELGLVFSVRAANKALSIWGRRGQLDAIELVVQAMIDGGLTPDHTAAYITIRTALNTRAYGRVPALERLFVRELKVRMKPTLQRLLQLHRSGLEAAGVSLAGGSGAK